jgi:predicted amidohydrolase
MMTTRALTLAVAQFTPEFGKKKKNLSRMQELVEDVTADIFVFPELCTTGYFFQSRAEVARAAETIDGPGSEFFQDMARSKNAVVVAGLAESHQKNLYNACLVVVPEEKRPHVYRKTHLFYKEKDCFDPGDTGFFVVTDKKRNVRIGPMVCYDWRFPESARVLTLLGADLIVCPANLITEAWRRVMPARAIENNVYLAVAIYDFSGREIKKAGEEKDEVLLAEIYPLQTRDKSFNPINDVLNDRQPQHYTLLTRIVK